MSPKVKVSLSYKLEQRQTRGGHPSKANASRALWTTFLVFSPHPHPKLPCRTLNLHSPPGRGKVLGGQVGGEGEGQTAFLPLCPKSKQSKSDCLVTHNPLGRNTFHAPRWVST
jgi:hypothetical protein